MLKALPWLGSIAQRNSTYLALDLRGAALENALLLLPPLIITRELGDTTVRGVVIGWLVLVGLKTRHIPQRDFALVLALARSGSEVLGNHFDLCN